MGFPLSPFYNTGTQMIANVILSWNSGTLYCTATLHENSNHNIGVYLGRFLANWLHGWGCMLVLERICWGCPDKVRREQSALTCSPFTGATRDGRCVERAGTWVSLSQSKLFPVLCKHAIFRDCGFPRLEVPFLWVRS